ncbi:MAG: hypothetical protein LBR12_00490 [Opitutaceae bacterium]|jgi:hypothetical protein|nr:hypothetical protein [Opitutaceae bacterium]
MSLTPEQNRQVAAWVEAGDSLSAVQKKLLEHFQVSMTYMDVRFLVDDLQLQLKDPPAKKTDAALQPGAPAAPRPDGDIDEDDTLPADDAAGDAADAAPPPAGEVVVQVDDVTLDPTAIASGSVCFSDNVTGKWIIDQQGRPALTDTSRPGYRPSQADAQDFMRKLAAALRQKGLM